MENKRYGKSVGDVLKIKSDFFEKNQAMLEMSENQADALLIQPKREVCKICHSPLEGEPLYTSQRMSYHLCPKCGHLNSDYEDTNDFADRVYLVDRYELNYSEDDRAAYENRMKSIYIPKAEFLLEGLAADGLSKDDIHLLDDGAGSGYFVRAMRSLGCDAKGIEISPSQVEFANTMASEEILKSVESSEASSIIASTESNVISFIGVLEHIINLDETIATIRENKNIKYIYFSVPMFSMSCVFEAAHQNCYNRHAGGTHTHLFSDSSIAYMLDEMGFEAHKSWKFGSDIMDLYRMLSVCLDSNGNGALKDYFAPKFKAMIDDLQLVIDKNEFASEIHMLARRKSD